jgi:hypothetical protein
MSEQHEKTPSATWGMMGPDLLFGSLFDSGRYALDRWTHALFECGSELSAFAMTRWQQELESWKALSTCRSPEELMQCQYGYAQKAATDYMAEAGKLTQVMMDAASAAFAPSESAAPVPRESWAVTPAAPSQPPAAKRETKPAPAMAGDKPRKKRDG